MTARRRRRPRGVGRGRRGGRSGARQRVGDANLDRRVIIAHTQRRKPGLRALVAEMNAIALANEGIGEELPPSRPAVGRVGDVNVPVLVINGGLDALRTRAAADWLAAELPDARRIVMSGLTHLPNMERPGRIQPAGG